MLACWSRNRFPMFLAHRRQTGKAGSINSNTAHVVSSFLLLCISKALYEMLCPVHILGGVIGGGAVKMIRVPENSISILLAVAEWTLRCDMPGFSVHEKLQQGWTELFLSKLNGRETTDLYCNKYKFRSDTEKTCQLWKQKYWNNTGRLHYYWRY